MLPKVSFTDEEKDENGSKMLSRMGKMTRYNYPVFYGVDPISVHQKYLQAVKKKEEFGNVDHSKQAKAMEE